MNATEIKAITEERLEAWAQRVAENHCTPAVLVAIGHDHKKGDLHICVPNEMPLEMARGFMAAALKEFDRAIKQGKKS